VNAYYSRETGNFDISLQIYLVHVCPQITKLELGLTKLFKEKHDGVF